MEARKQSYLNMYHQVAALCEDNLTVVAQVPAFETCYLLFKSTVSGIVSKAALLESQTGGLKISKRSGKKELAKTGSEIAGLVFAYGESIGDEVLTGAMDITDSDIIRASDEEAASICTNILTTASAHVAILGDYGVTPAVLSEFETSIDDYVRLSPKPRGSRSEKKAARGLMFKQFEEAHRLLKNRMDKVAVNFTRNGNTDFYLQYRAARVLTDPRRFKTVLKLLVLNATTHEPMRNVKCYRDLSAGFKLSSNKGLVTYKDAEEGNHTFKLKRKLFKDAETTVMVSYGEKKVVTVVMEVG